MAGVTEDLGEEEPEVLVWREMGRDRDTYSRVSPI